MPRKTIEGFLDISDDIKNDIKEDVTEALIQAAPEIARLLTLESNEDAQSGIVEIVASIAAEIIAEYGERIIETASSMALGVTRTMARAQAND